MTQLDREAFLAALLTGDLSLNHPQVQERLRAEPELLTMLEQLRNVEAAVARAAGEQREVLDAARRSEDTALDDRVTAGVQQVVGERLRSRRIKWFAAAAVLVAGLLLGWFLFVRTPTASGELWLGSDVRLDPKGVVDKYSPFTWAVEPSAGGRFVLRIYSVIDGRRDRLLKDTETEKVTSPWRMTADQEAALPDEIDWELEVIGGDMPEVFHARAQRRR